MLRTVREGAWASLLLILRWGNWTRPHPPTSGRIIHICKKVGLAALPRNPLNFVGVRVHDVIPRCNQMVAQASSLCTKESVLTGSQVELGNPAKLSLATLPRVGRASAPALPKPLTLPWWHRLPACAQKKPCFPSPKSHHRFTFFSNSAISINMQNLSNLLLMPILS